MEKEQLGKYRTLLNRYKKTSKGWVLIYVVIIAMVISLTICFSMKSFVNRNFYIKNYVEYNLNENYEHSDKEHLMARFNSYVLKDIESIKVETIDKYFGEKVGEKLISYDNSYITYNLKDKIFQVHGLNRIYKFAMEINEDRIIYIFKEN